jgi:hypothetical protein
MSYLLKVLMDVGKLIGRALSPALLDDPAGFSLEPDLLDQFLTKVFDGLIGGALQLHLNPGRGLLPGTDPYLETALSLHE